MNESPSPSEPVTPKGRRISALLFFLAAAIAVGVGIPILQQGACPSCTGLLSLVLPWLGAAFYSVLAVLSWRSPRSPHLTNLLSFALFVHACLVVEMLLLDRLCASCLTIAALAAVGAALHGWRSTDARVPILTGLILGGAAGFVYPADRVEDKLTRRFWPAHVLTQAPAFVDLKELASCSHSSRVRLLAYEDERTCQSCRGLSKRLFPMLAQEFPDVCVHPHIIRNPGSGQLLPVLVFLSRENRLLVSEGVPDDEELRSVLKAMRE